MLAQRKRFIWMTNDAAHAFCGERLDADVRGEMNGGIPRDVAERFAYYTSQLLYVSDNQCKRMRAALVARGHTDMSTALACVDRKWQGRSMTQSTIQAISGGCSGHTMVFADLWRELAVYAAKEMPENEKGTFLNRMFVFYRQPNRIQQAGMESRYPGMAALGV